MAYQEDTIAQLNNVVTKQDADIIQLIDALATKTYSYTAHTSAVVNGASGMLALQMAVNTGRLYATSNDRLQGEPLKLGPVQHLKFDWQEVKESSAAKGTPCSGNCRSRGRVRLANLA